MLAQRICPPTQKSQNPYQPSRQKYSDTFGEWQCKSSSSNPHGRSEHIDYLKKNDHKTLKDLFFNGFTQVLNNAAHITFTSSTLIDVVSTNHPINISNTALIAAGLSNHDLTACIRKMNMKIDDLPRNNNLLFSYEFGFRTSNSILH